MAEKTAIMDVDHADLIPWIWVPFRWIVWLFLPASLYYRLRPGSVVAQKFVELNGAGRHPYIAFAENFPGDIFITLFADAAPCSNQTALANTTHGD